MHYELQVIEFLIGCHSKWQMVNVDWRTETVLKSNQK